MTTLSERLRERIKRDGPITFRDWMDAALYDPQEGYYRRADRVRWGRAGDYRTSPERSPLFAATFARYFTRLYHELNSPPRWTIVEVGAGDGQFAEGLLHALQQYAPLVFSATRYLIDESSAASRAVAQEQLARFGERVQFGSLRDAEPIDSGVVFSNELLDAFPVHRLTCVANDRREFYVDVDSDGRFAWTTGELSEPRLHEYLDSVGVRLGDGQVAEVNLAIEDWLTVVAAKLRSGYVVTVDYGAEAAELFGTVERQQGTLRAFRRHQLADDLLAEPGRQDITTTIDWTFVKQIGARLGLETTEFERQDRFLLQAGLLEGLDVLLAEANDEGERLRLRTGVRELILPTGMAASFQVLVQKK
jgi:SAM-dependent MidA family methyltransferase